MIIDPQDIVLVPGISHGDITVSGIALLPVRAQTMEADSGDNAFEKGLGIPHETVETLGAAMALHRFPTEFLIRHQVVAHTVYLERSMIDAVPVPAYGTSHEPVAFLECLDIPRSGHHVIRFSVLPGHEDAHHTGTVIAQTDLGTRRIGKSKQPDLLPVGEGSERFRDHPGLISTCCKDQKRRRQKNLSHFSSSIYLVHRFAGTRLNDFLKNFFARDFLPRPSSPNPAVYQALALIPSTV